MTAWIYLFSKFTSEALLLEALAILFLVGGYAAFWILRKRRFGAIRVADVPSPVVKAYLNQLISDAHQMRVQLFGLLSAAGAVPPQEVASLRLMGASPDSGLQSKLEALESRMSDQMIAYERILGEKERIEQDLARMRAGQSGGAQGLAPAGSAPGSDELPKLRDKIAILEARLAEYSVIEDDLANLKRLQQENAQLRTQLGVGPGAGPRIPGSTDPALAGAAAPSSRSQGTPGPAEPGLSELAARAQEPNGTGQPDDRREPGLAGSDVPSPEPELKSAALAAAAAVMAAQAEPGSSVAGAEIPPGDGPEAGLQAGSQPGPHADAEAIGQAQVPERGLASDEGPGLDNRVEQVEKSLATSAEAGKMSDLPVASDSAQAAGTPGAARKPEKSGASTAPIPKANVEKSDEDLIAEFEKMLGS